MSKKKKIEKEQAKIKSQEDNLSQEVKMKFKEDKFYKSQTEVHFEKDKVYSVKGADQIQRWLKRGGEIVEGELELPKQEQNPSVVVVNPPAPVANDPESVDSEDNKENPEDSEQDQEDQQEESA